MTTDLTWTAWRKSSYSGQSQDCVEVSGGPTALIGMRDSKDPDGPALAFTFREWRAFIAGVKSSQLRHQ